jgi:hypothetical protein
VETSSGRKVTTSERREKEREKNAVDSGHYFCPHLVIPRKRFTVIDYSSFTSVD